MGSMNSSAGPIEVQEAAASATMITEIGIVPGDKGVPVLVVIGGAANLDAATNDTTKNEPSNTESDPNQRFRILLSAFFEHAVRPAVRSAGAVVITGGTNAGIMRIAGETLNDVARALVGVAPGSQVGLAAGLVNPEPHHHFLVRGRGATWGSETEVMFRLAETLASNGTSVLVLLGNGGEVAEKEARQFLDAGWPIAVIAGSGGYADQLAEAVAPRRPWSRWTRRSKEASRANVERLTAGVGAGRDSRQRILWRLHEDVLLKLAWLRYVALNEAANGLKRQSSRWQALVGFGSLVFFVVVSLLAQLAVNRVTTPGGQLEPAAASEPWARLLPVLEALATSLPLALTVVVGLSGFLAAERRWRAVRAGAESLLRQIYRYRAAKLSNYPQASAQLRSVMAAVDSAVAASGAPLAGQNLGVVRERPAGLHDPLELAELTPKAYLEHRVDKQLSYFRRKAMSAQRVDAFLLAITGATTAVAMVLVGTKYSVWVSLLFLFAAGLGSRRARVRGADRVSAFNQAVAGVQRARVAWTGSQQDEAAFLTLVTEVELALEREAISWEETVRLAAQTAETPVPAA